MKIGIETSLLQHPAGIGKYLNGIVDVLPQVAPQHTYAFLKNPLWSPDQFGKTKSSLTRLRSGLGKLWGEQVLVPWLARRQGVEVLFVPDYTGPVLASLFGLKLVVVFYDMAFALRPEEQHHWYLAYFRMLAPLTARAAQRIITISQASKRDIVHLWNIPADKIIPIYLASRPVYHQDRQAMGPTLIRYGLEAEQYILHVGTPDVRKNIPRLISAFDILAAEKRFDSFKLVLAGGAGWKPEEEQRIQQAISSERLAGRVVRAGYVSDQELAHLYNGAAAFVFPSLYEGFGLPVLEAMSCGTPVITSNVSSLPEVAGDAAVLIDPESIEDIAAAMREVLDKPDYRQALIARGLEWAQTFSWPRTALETVQVFESICSGQTGGGR